MTISNQASDSFVAEVDAQNFQATVIEKSQQVPVVLEFYAQGAAPSEALTATLSSLVQSYQGKIFWARVNVQTNPQIVQQLGVRGLPTIKIVKDGQLHESLEGLEGSPRDALLHIWNAFGRQILHSAFVDVVEHGVDRQITP